MVACYLSTINVLNKGIDMRVFARKLMGVALIMVAALGAFVITVFSRPADAVRIPSRTAPLIREMMR